MSKNRTYRLTLNLLCSAIRIRGRSTKSKNGCIRHGKKTVIDVKTVITQDEFEEFSAIAEFIFEHTEPCENLTEFREIHAQVVRDRVTAATEVSDYDLHRYNFLSGSYGYSLRRLRS